MRCRVFDPAWTGEGARPYTNTYGNLLTWNR